MVLSRPYHRTGLYVIWTGRLCRCVSPSAARPPAKQSGVAHRRSRRSMVVSRRERASSLAQTPPEHGDRALAPGATVTTAVPAFPQGRFPGGATRPGRCDGGTPAGSGNRQVSGGSLPYLPPVPIVCTWGWCVALGSRPRQQNLWVSFAVKYSEPRDALLLARRQGCHEAGGVLPRS